MRHNRDSLGSRKVVTFAVCFESIGRVLADQPNRSHVSQQTA